MVDDPALLPGEVCIGDRYKIGTAVFVVSGPRQPCPKVDAMHGVKGLTKFTLERGWAGYFLMVENEGSCFVGDAIELLDRPFPGFTLERVARGLWGPTDQLDQSFEFLSTLAQMEPLIPRHYRDVAISRLERFHGQ